MADLSRWNGTGAQPNPELIDTESGQFLRQPERVAPILAAGIGKDAKATLEGELQAAHGKRDEADASLTHIGPLLDVRFVESASTHRDLGELQKNLDAD